MKSKWVRFLECQYLKGHLGVKKLDFTPEASMLKKCCNCAMIFLSNLHTLVSCCWGGSHNLFISLIFRPFHFLSLQNSVLAGNAASGTGYVLRMVWADTVWTGFSEFLALHSSYMLLLTDYWQTIFRNLPWALSYGVISFSGWSNYVYLGWCWRYF